MYKLFSDFKEERIDNQYYVPVIGTEPVNRKKCLERIKDAQNFNFTLRTYMAKITNKKIKEIRNNFLKL